MDAEEDIEILSMWCWLLEKFVVYGIVIVKIGVRSI